MPGYLSARCADLVAAESTAWHDRLVEMVYVIQVVVAERVRVGERRCVQTHRSNDKT